jgi:hypothetical protein
MLVEFKSSLKVAPNTVEISKDTSATADADAVTWIVDV